jgi:hypothetical protein
VFGREHLAPILGNEDQVDMEREYTAPTSPDVVVIGHRPMLQ